MANFTSDSFLPFWISNATAFSASSDVGPYTPPISATSTEYIVRSAAQFIEDAGRFYGSYFIRYIGAGFTYSITDGGQRIPTGGTYTVIEIYDNDFSTVLATVTGISLPLVNVFSQTVESVFSGNDTLTGGSRAGERLYGGAGDDVLNAGGSDLYTFLGGASKTRDMLFGGLGNDLLIGGSGQQTLDGGDGNDAINGGGGNDAIIGGDGVDTAGYASGRANYALTTDPDGSARITDLRSGSPEGSDILVGVERVQFAGVSHALTTFNPVTSFDFNWHVVAVGDFNGDGTSDIVWQNPSGILGGWLMRNGTIAGTLQLPDFPGWTPAGTGDFNSDGVDDIFWMNASGLVGEWLMGNGTRQATIALQNMAGWHVIATGDFNNDRVDDVIWRSDTGFIGGWLMANGQIAGTLQLPFFPGWEVVVTGDFNNDGNTDLIWKNGSGLLGEWLMANGTRSATLGLGSMPGWDVIASGDFNGDGTDDIMWRNGSGETAAWIMLNGQVSGTIGYGSTAGYHVVAFGDFDGNGTGDVAWQNASTGAITTWRMNGNARPTFALIPESGSGNAMSDADGDVRQTYAGTSGNDVIIANPDTKTLTGNGGSDVFIFREFGGNATITDFDPATDRIEFSGYAFQNIDQLLINVLDNLDGNAVLQVGPVSSITLLDLNKSQLLANNFDFT